MIYETYTPCGWYQNGGHCFEPNLLIEHLGPRELSPKGEPIVLNLYVETEDGWTLIAEPCTGLIEAAIECLMTQSCE